MSKLTRIARELLTIEEDFQFRVNNPLNKPHDFDLYIFEQIWGSTALGFGGVGGDAMTSAMTYVFVPQVEDDCIVYFAGRFAYKVPYSRVFADDIAKQHMESVYRAGKYTKAAKEQYDGSRT